MSAPSITDSYKDQFSNDVRMVFQQRSSRLKGSVSVQPLAAQNQMFDFISPIEATQRTGRSQPVAIANTEHFRRACTMQVWEANDFVDKFEQNIVAPAMAQKYATNFGGSLGRQYDRLVINAALGTAYGGRDGKTPISFDTANQQIAVDYDEAGTTGTNHNITLGKLRRGLAILTGNETLGDDDAPANITVAYGANQLHALLRIAQTLGVMETTRDSLMSGRPTVMMGMKFIRLSTKVQTGLTTVLPATAAGYRHVVMWSPDSIAYCEAQNVNVAIDWIPENKSWLVATDFQGDAARLREDGVVDILCDETILT